MSTAAGAPPNGAKAGLKSPDSKNKGKGKGVTSPDVSMEEEEEEDEEDEDDDEEMDAEADKDDDADDDDEEEEGLNEIDPSQIIGRRTRGVRVDYTSKEALEKAGLKPEDDEDDEEMK